MNSIANIDSHAIIYSRSKRCSARRMPVLTEAVKATNHKHPSSVTWSNSVPSLSLYSSLRHTLSFFFFCASRLHFFIIFLFCLFIYRITLVFSFFRLSLSYSLSQTHSILIACLVTTRPHYSFTTARALCDGHIRNPTISAGIIAATSANTSRTCDASEKTNSVQWLVVCYVLPLPTDLSAIFASIYKAPGYYLGASTDAKPSTNTRFQIHPTIASFILLFFHLSDNNRNIRTGQILSWTQLKCPLRGSGVHPLPATPAD